MDLLKTPEALEKYKYFQVDTLTIGEVVIGTTTYINKKITHYIQNVFWGI